MGWIKHNAIVVTVAGYIGAKPMQEAADRIFGEGTCQTMKAEINGTRTLLVPPDGSKEGWGDSDLGDAKRGAFIAWLNDQVYEDGSSPYSWVEVEYGEIAPSITRSGGNHEPTEEEPTP